ncbi:MAG: hypothetical protein ACI8P0_005462, partial [Planctomycetaceae bacterium]
MQSAGLAWAVKKLVLLCCAGAVRFLPLVGDSRTEFSQGCASGQDLG